MNDFTRKIHSLFREALAKTIEPDHIFPVILMGLVREDITEDETDSLINLAALIREIDKAVRSLQRQVDENRPPISDTLLQSVSNQLLNDIRAYIDEETANVLLERMLDDLKLDRDQLED